jgi:M6 family metalloprotease-like protein
MNKLSVILLLALSQLLINPAYAVKANPDPIIITQPDGTQLTIWLYGDERNHYKTTVDGYLLKTNSTGYLAYATLNSVSEIVESEFIAHDVDKRSEKEIDFLKTIPLNGLFKKMQSRPQKTKGVAAQTNVQSPIPLKGLVKTLVILVNYSDKSFTIPAPQTSFSNLLNEVGYSANGGTGSARDYFMESSYGKFCPNFDVVGPYTLPQNSDFYGGDGFSGAPQMVIDACTAANAAGLDFTQYDLNNDGVLDNVFVIFPGYNMAESSIDKIIWPHRWFINTGTTALRTFDGKLLNGYACTSEFRDSRGENMCGIGTFCHEFSHVLGLPDLAIYRWSLMGGAMYNLGRTPPILSAYERFYLGFLKPQIISTPSRLQLQPIYQGKTSPENTDNQAFLISATAHNLNGISPNPGEFFLLEYRKKTNWDTYLPADGMLIWHIDYDEAYWNSNLPNEYLTYGTEQTTNNHMRVYIESVDGRTSTTGSVFTTGSFTPTSWAGVDLNRSITDITKTENAISFNFMGYTNDIPATTEKGISLFNSGNTIYIRNSHNSEGGIILYDVAGRFIQQLPFAANTVTTLLTNVKAGVYIAKIIVAGEALSERLVLH